MLILCLVDVDKVGLCMVVVLVVVVTPVGSGNMTGDIFDLGAHIGIFCMWQGKGQCFGDGDGPVASASVISQGYGGSMVRKLGGFDNLVGFAQGGQEGQLAESL